MQRKQKGQFFRGDGREIDGIFVHKIVVLHIHAVFLVIREIHLSGRFFDAPELRFRHAALLTERGQPFGIFFRQQRARFKRKIEHAPDEKVRIKVVIHDGIVFVRPADDVDAELSAPRLDEAAAVGEALRHFKEHLRAVIDHKRLVAGGVVIRLHREGNIRVDVVLRRRRLEDRAALLSVDGIPAVKRADVLHLPRTLPRTVQKMIAVQEQIAGNFLRAVSEHRHHVHLGVPEGLPAVNGAGQPVCRNIRIAVPAGGLIDLKEGKADPLLHERVVVDLDIRIRPERRDFFRVFFEQRLVSPRGRLAHFLREEGSIIGDVLIAGEPRSPLVNGDGARIQ